MRVFNPPDFHSPTQPKIKTPKFPFTAKSSAALQALHSERNHLKHLNPPVTNTNTNTNTHTITLPSRPQPTSRSSTIETCKIPRPPVPWTQQIVNFTVHESRVVANDIGYLWRAKQAREEEPLREVVRKDLKGCM